MYNRPGPEIKYEEAHSKKINWDVFAEPLSIDNIPWAKFSDIHIEGTIFPDAFNFYTVLDEFNLKQAAFTFLAGPSIASTIYTHTLMKKLMFDVPLIRTLNYAENDHFILRDKLMVLPEHIRDNILNDKSVAVAIITKYVPTIPLGDLSQKSVALTMDCSTSESRSLMMQLGMLYSFSKLSNRPIKFKEILFVMNPKSQHITFSPNIDSHNSRFTKLLPFPVTCSTVNKNDYSQQESLVNVFADIKNHLEEIIEDLLLFKEGKKEINSLNEFRSFLVEHYQLKIQYSTLLCIFVGCVCLINSIRLLKKEQFQNMHNYIRIKLLPDYKNSIEQQLKDLTHEYFLEVQSSINTLFNSHNDDIAALLKLFPEELPQFMFKENLQFELAEMEIDDSYDIEKPIETPKVTPLADVHIEEQKEISAIPSETNGQDKKIEEPKEEKKIEAPKEETKEEIVDIQSSLIKSQTSKKADLKGSLKKSNTKK